MFFQKELWSTNLDSRTDKTHHISLILAGLGTCFYYCTHFDTYKLHSNLQAISHSESTFIETTQDKVQIVVDCVYKHPSMELEDFNND